MENIRIRKAEVKHAEFISLLARMTFTETFGHYFRDHQDLIDYYASTFSVAKIRSSLNKPNNVFWIAFSNDLPVGYAKLKIRSKFELIEEDDVSQLQKIYVLKDFLGKGIGKLLFEALQQECFLLKSKYLWLAVLFGNDNAIEFYQKNGFVAFDKHIFKLGDDEQTDILMRLKLTP